MKFSPKTAFVAIAFALALLLFSAVAHADGFLDDDFTYYYKSGKAYVTGLQNQSATHITIPSSVVYEYTTFDDEVGHNVVEHRTCSVVGIANGAFSGCSQLASVTIPHSVTRIESSAFSGCSGLTSMTIPDSVTVIRDEAFSGCSGLTSVTIPNSVTDIASKAFYGCTGLTSVTIPDSVTRIGDYAFAGCNGLTSVTIPDSVSIIGNQAFAGCNGLRQVTILGNHYYSDVSYLEASDRPFYGCTNITTLVLGGNMTRIANNMFYGCSGLTSVTIGDSVMRIGHSAFTLCTNLTSVTIPDNVTVIGDAAFSSCHSLRSVMLGKGTTNILAQAFNGCSSLESFSVASGNPDYQAHSGLLLSKDGTTLVFGVNGDVVVPSSVTRIGPFAFCAHSGLASVSFEGAPPSVGDWDYPASTGGAFAFYGVASGARGFYRAEHAAEWEEVIVDGKWQGLIMEQVERPVAAPPELQVQSADPAKGSIKLVWEDEGGGDGVTYSVWRGAGNERSAADCVAPSVMGNTWTDEGYWEAKPVLEPLNYWVVANGGGYGERESDPVETRRRFGVFVGLSDFAWYNLRDTKLPQFANDAEKLRDLFVKYGGMQSDNTVLLTNSDAKRVDVRKTIEAKKEVVLPGDLFVLYFATHGEYTDGFARLILYDSRSREDQGLQMTELFGMLDDFDSGAVVIPIIMACHSGAFADYAAGSVTDTTGKGFEAFVDAGLAMCRGNMPVLASCGAAEESSLVRARDYSDFGEAFFLHGWEEGYADGEVYRMGVPAGNGNGYVSFLELIQYAKGFARGASDAVRSHVKWMEEYNTMLGRLTAGRVPDVTVRCNVPDTPQNIKASDGTKDSGIEVSWDATVDAEWYSLYRLKDGRTGESEQDWNCIFYKIPENEFFNNSQTEVGKVYQYRVCALNGAGSSEPSVKAPGRRGTNKLLGWLKEIGAQLGLFGTAAELATMPSANGETLEACYVSGIDPLDANATFTAELCREDGKWKAKPKGGEKEGRVYSVEGKKEMSDEFWTDVTDVEDLEAEGWHFFRVGVQLAE